MKRVMVLLACLALFASAAVGQEPNSPTAQRGVTAWGLLGVSPELARSEELRVGYQGLLPGLEVAGGVLHLDAPEPAVEEWGGRLYAIFHALDANMIATFLGQGIQLPPGDVYGGIFGQYTYDRENEWSGGYVVGGLVNWPGQWQTVGEYQTTLWNVDDPAHVFVLGLRKQF